MGQGPETRIGAARDRAAAAKVLLAGAAVGAFGLFLALARVSHPAAAQSAGTGGGAAPAVAERQAGGGYGGGAIAPYDRSFVGPSARSGTS